MTGGKKERSASLSLIHEQLSMGETVSTVGRRRRNGLGDIFQGLSQNDVNTLRAHSASLNGRSLSCPCARGTNNDSQGDSSSKRSNSKRRFHLLHNKHWARRRIALGDIFADIPSSKINELLCLSLHENSSHKPECENRSLHKRRFALADIFSCVPVDKIEELIHGSIDNEDLRARLSDCPSSEEEYLENEVFDTDSDLRLSKAQCRRRCALGNIFVDISPEGVEKLISRTNEVTDEETVVFENKCSAETVTENQTISNTVLCRNEEIDEHVNELNDYQSNLYVRTFFRSLLNQHHKHRLGYMTRTMSLPCYTQYDMAQHVSTDKRRNGQGDVLCDISCQDFYSLKGKYVSSVVYASC